MNLNKAKCQCQIWKKGAFHVFCGEQQTLEKYKNIISEIRFIYLGIYYRYKQLGIRYFNNIITLTA